MNPEDLVRFSEIFQNSDPDAVASRLNRLNRAERKLFSQLCFDLSKRVYCSILEDSIAETFSKIHQNMARMFYTQIFHVDQNLKADPDMWQRKLAILREIQLFSDISDFDLLTIAETIEEVHLVANEPFQEQYEEVKGVHLLKDSANVYEFNSKAPVTSRSGIFGGDVCATGEVTSSITVKPVSDCKALFIPRHKFVDLIKRVPGLQGKVLQSAVERAKQGSVRAEEQRRLTQEILDNIGQGSFSINVAGEIGENYTSLAANYLGSDNLAGVPFADLVFRNEREVLRNYYRALHMLFSGNEFNHNVVLDLLPNEVTIHDRMFNLHYSFVQDGTGHVMSVFVRMEDVTLQRELAEKEEKQRSITMRMQANIGGFMDMLEELESTYNCIEIFAEDYWAVGRQPTQGVLADIMRSLHGSKGLSGQFELSELKSAVHRLEDWFLAVDNDGIEKHSESFKGLLTKFEAEYQYALSFKENLGEGIIQILNGVSYTSTEFDELAEAVMSGDVERAKQLVMAKKEASVEKIVGNWKSDALRLAKRLNKQIEFSIYLDSALTVPKDLAKKLNVNLAHLYRNCVDHGIEMPQERLERKKELTGRIDVILEGDHEHLVIEISDDGRGIDEQKIAALAQANSNLDQELVAQYIQNGEYWRLLFLPGFSSAETVTDISGRGVGMDAVNRVVTEAHGKIEVNSYLGKGTSFVVRIPLTP